MTFLGYKLAATYDNPSEGFWGNLPIGTKMLECAFAQGYGDAAEKLGLIYARANTNEAKLRALKVLHEGVKLGSAKCADNLVPEFNGMDLDNGTNLVGHIDKARAQRYALPPQRYDFLKQMINAGFLREVPEPVPPVRCNGQQRCAQTGIWESRVADDHPMAALYNRWDRQAFVEKDHAFPQPAAQFIDVAAHDLQWTYLGSPNAETGMPGIREIGL